MEKTSNEHISQDSEQVAHEAQHMPSKSYRSNLDQNNVKKRRATKIRISFDGEPPPKLVPDVITISDDNSQSTNQTSVSTPREVSSINDNVPRMCQIIRQSNDSAELRAIRKLVLIMNN